MTAHDISDLDRTLEAIAARGWQVVLLAPREKRPCGKRWDITSNVARVAHHLGTGGNLGLLTNDVNGIAAWTPMISSPGRT